MLVLAALPALAFFAYRAIGKITSKTAARETETIQQAQQTAEPIPTSPPAQSGRGGGAAPVMADAYTIKTQTGEIVAGMNALAAAWRNCQAARTCSELAAVRSIVDQAPNVYPAGELESLRAELAYLESILPGADLGALDDSINRAILTMNRLIEFSNQQ